MYVTFRDGFPRRVIAREHKILSSFSFVFFYVFRFFFTHFEKKTPLVFPGNFLPPFPSFQITCLVLSKMAQNVTCAAKVGKIRPFVDERKAPEKEKERENLD